MKKSKSNLTYWAILAILGIFLIVGHNAAVNIICKVFGAALILFAVPGVVSWWKTKSKAPEALARLIGSVAFCAVGLWILFNTPAFVRFINVLVGLVILIPSAVSLYRAWKNGRDIVPMVLAALGIVLGLVIACNNIATTWVAVCAGAGLVYTAVTGFLADRR